MPSNGFLRRAMIAFSAGALGALVQTVFLWLATAIGIPDALGVKIAPKVELPFLYSRLVWGGIWGFTLLLPIFGHDWVKRGVLLGVATTAALLLIFFPMRGVGGTLGMGLGVLAPLYLFVVHVIYGLVTCWWWETVGERREALA